MGTSAAPPMKSQELGEQHSSINSNGGGVVTINNNFNSNLMIINGDELEQKHTKIKTAALPTRND